MENSPDDLHITRSLGALRAPTSSWRPFGPLDFVLRALRALRLVRRARFRSGPLFFTTFTKFHHFEPFSKNALFLLGLTLSGPDVPARAAEGREGRSQEARRVSS